MSTLLRPRLNLNVYFRRRFVEIAKQRRAQPTLRIEILRVVDVSSPVRPSPTQPKLAAGKRVGRKDHHKALVSVRQISGHSVNHGVGAANKGFGLQPNARIVKHPHIEVAIGCDDVDAIHGLVRRVDYAAGCC